MEDLKNIKENLADINARIKNAYDQIPNNPNKYPTLLAVSKLKSKEAIIEAYQCGQRHFGENYIQELDNKANDAELLAKCPEIKWHMIGHIQTNKVNKLLSVPNLYCIQTVDSIKLADTINAAINRNSNIKEKIKCFAQINTSGEKEKSGVDPDFAIDLVKFITEKCDRLQFGGLMTIGFKFGETHDLSTGPNPDFLKLIDVRNKVSDHFGKPKEEIELSMGMTDDFEHAISLGSNVVRVGRAIFGERPKKETQ